MRSPHTFRKARNWRSSFRCRHRSLCPTAKMRSGRTSFARPALCEHTKSQRLHLHRHPPSFARREQRRRSHSHPGACGESGGTGRTTTCRCRPPLWRGSGAWSRTGTLWRFSAHPQVSTSPDQSWSKNPARRTTCTPCHRARRSNISRALWPSRRCHHPGVPPHAAPCAAAGPHSEKARSVTPPFGPSPSPPPRTSAARSRWASAALKPRTRRSWRCTL
mmetsp:Transcript_134690/g.319256  ORF Transcript_134690/g.319256 Transcript_134690/m.319256 type:complete len:219 (+) Transcript_134690:851-1507(+)